MPLDVTRCDGACGAEIRGIDLTAPLSDDVIAEIRALWLEHHVLVFPDQPMSDDDLERFTGYFGGFGEDPFIDPIAGRKHVLAIERAADETAPIFADSWHTDWSFQASPPAGTCLLGIEIPPVGGDTLFATQHAAYEQMPDELRARVEGKTAIHSARAGYGAGGLYGDREKDVVRAMKIRSSEAAEAEQTHPLVREHPETGRLGLFGCIGYVCGIEGMAQEEAGALLIDLLKWQTQERFQYRHRWQRNMLVMWDNRSVLHRASDGYDGHARLLHRTTIAAA